MLPDFSAISAPASETFSAITNFASEGWASIQAEWNQLPGFFEGIWAGVGGVASAAGSVIASGINSAIGAIQSAWEGLSSWLSAKISSLSSMASSAVSAVTSFVDGEIIDLPSGTRIYPHATTMKMLQRDISNGEFDGMGNYFSSISNTGFTELSNTSFPILPQTELSTFPQAISFDDMIGNTGATCSVVKSYCA